MASSTSHASALRTGQFHPSIISLTRDSCVVAGPAKVNLHLELLGKRPDGYHELETLIVPVNWYDTLELQLHPTDLLLTCDRADIPAGPGNLVWKAAEAIRSRAGISRGVRIHLTKRIPHEAGLGGGSSDAAMTLIGLNHLWNCGFSPEQLAEIAGAIGSDVAAFLPGSAVWCTGRGEKVTAIPARGPLHLVLVKPPVGLSTASVYQNVVLPTEPHRGNAIREALAEGDVMPIAKLLHNRLQTPAFGLQSSVKSLYDGLMQCGAIGVLLSGSGSCVFALGRDQNDASRIARTLTAKHGSDWPGCRIAVVRTIVPPTC